MLSVAGLAVRHAEPLETGTRCETASVPTDRSQPGRTRFSCYREPLHRVEKDVVVRSVSIDNG